MIWTEKYRPKSLTEFIGDTDKIRELVKSPMSMPHLLLVSKSPGTGKTSLAYIVQNEVGTPDSDFLVLNSSDDRKLESVRGKIKDFCVAMRSREDSPRLILLDEADGMLSASQDALRFLMEKYAGNVKFILTANDENDIIEPIKSRCVVMRMRDIKKEEIYKRLLQICNNEKLAPGDDAVRKIIDIHYPDMRSMINHMQELYPHITIDRVHTKTELTDKYYTFLKEPPGNPFTARKFLIEMGMDAHDTLKETFERFMAEETIPHEVKKEIAYFVAEISFRMKFGADPEIQMFAASLKFADMFKRVRTMGT